MKYQANGGTQNLKRVDHSIAKNENVSNLWAMTEFSNGLLFCDVSTVQIITLAWRHENWGDGARGQRLLYDTYGITVVVHSYLL